jgi:hypothetical protein
MASAAVRNVTARSAESSPPAAIHLRPSAPREHDLGRTFAIEHRASGAACTVQSLLRCESNGISFTLEI